MAECKKCFHYNVCDGDIRFGYAECPQFISVTDVSPRNEIIDKFVEKLISRFDSLEYNANTKRKTIKIDELKDQVDWILHDVAIETIRNLAKELKGE